jgi:hypothetical protein
MRMATPMSSQLVDGRASSDAGLGNILSHSGFGNGRGLRRMSSVGAP